MMTALYAGAAVRRITPDLDAGPAYLAGFQANRPATGVHDHLHVRAMALRAGESGDASPFLLAVCDLIGLLHADVLAIRRAAAPHGLDTSALVVACTHVHSGPDTIGLWGRSRLRSGVDPDYLAYARRRWSMPLLKPWRACVLRTCAPARHRWRPGSRTRATPRSSTAS